MWYYSLKNWVSKDFFKIVYLFIYFAHRSVNVNESSVVKHEQLKYKAEPRSIADYEPGRSSLAEREFEKV